MSLTKVSYSMIDGATVNILDFGAVGDWDGTSGTDNTSAIQAAIDACPNGGTVFVPAGYYLFSNVSKIGSVQIVGEGFTNNEASPVNPNYGSANWQSTANFSGSVLVSNATSGDAIALGSASGAAGNLWCFQMANLMIVGPGTGTTTAVHFTRGVGHYIENVLITNFSTAWNIDSCQDGTYNKIAAKGVRTGVTIGGLITSNQTVFLNPEFQHCEDYGAVLAEAANVNFYGGLFQDMRGGTALLIGANSSQALVKGVWFENYLSTYAISIVGSRCVIENCYFSGPPADSIIVRSGAFYTKLMHNYFNSIAPPPACGIVVEAGAYATYIFDSTPSSNGSISDFGTLTMYTDIQSGAVNQLIGSRAVQGTDTIGGVPRNAGTNTAITKKVTGLTDATLTNCLNVLIPNAATSATIRIKALGSIGAGGAIGANEASASLECDVIIARTAGLTAVVAQSASYGTATAAVAGATTCTVAVNSTTIAGAANADQTLIIQVSVTKGGGASTGHTVTLFAELLNMNDSGALIYA